MGSFFGAVHFRTNDRQAVLRWAERFVADTRTHVLVGPALRGWVAAYPAGKGQSAEGTKGLIGGHAGVALYLSLHDDDLVVFDLYQGATLQDSYWSIPDYFGRISAKKRKKLAGDPRKLADAIGPPASAETIAQTLEVKKGTRGPDLFEALADALGIPNAATCYEYLERGEREDIEGWSDFVHLPDRSVLQQAAAKEQAASGHEWAGKLSSGEIVGTTRLEAPGYLAALVPCGAQEYLVGSYPQRSAQPRPWQRWAAPWSATSAEPSGPSLDCPVAMSPSGHYLVTLTQTGHLTIRNEGGRGAVLRQEHGIGRVASFSFDENETHLRVVDGMRFATIPIGLGGTVDVPLQKKRPGEMLEVYCGVLHPSGHHVVLGGAGSSILQIRDLRRGLDEEPLTFGFRRGNFEPASQIHFQRVSFSRDGARIFVSSSRGMHVYDWSAVLVAGGPALPAPLAQLVFPSKGPGQGLVYCSSYNDAREGLICGGADGQMGFIDLRVGRSGLLPSLPEPLSILHLTPSLDGRFLAAACQDSPGGRDLALPPGNRLVVWRTEELWKRA